MNWALLIAQIIFELIKLWLKVKNPEEKKAYKEKVAEILDDAKSKGPTGEHFDRLKAIRDEILRKYN